MRWFAGPWVVVWALWAAGCGSPQTPPPDPGRLAPADAELMQGCYDCLIDARTEYRLLAAGADRPRLIARVFEADLLIALREKELGLGMSDALAEARRIAAELPPGVEAPRYLALVDAIPVNELAMPARELRTFLADHAAALGPPRDQAAWLSRGRLGPALRSYLRLALACAYPEAPAQGQAGTAAAPDGTAAAAPARLGSPLLDYRAAICGFGTLAALAAVRDREPRFVETSLFAANIELALAPRDGPGRAGLHLAEALARFPESPAIAYLTASYDLFIGDNAEALQLFDRTLAARPTHDRALLGRTICLDRLDRAKDAIESATRLFDLGETHHADAYFWRARSRRALGRLDDARRDITAAKAVAATGDVLSLSGIIAYEQADLDAARADLAAALDAGPGDCTARWYLALVHRQTKRWLDAGRAFGDAMACYRDRARDSGAQIQALEARSDLDPAYRERAAASLQASAAADIRQQHLAALTAASCFASGGDAVSARPMLDLAGEDPALADSVARLRGRLDSSRHAP